MNTDKTQTDKRVFACIVDPNGKGHAGYHDDREAFIQWTHAETDLDDFSGSWEDAVEWFRSIGGSLIESAEIARLHIILARRKCNALERMLDDLENPTQPHLKDAVRRWRSQDAAAGVATIPSSHEDQGND